MDNPNKFLINKGKDQLDIPQFENSSTQEFRSIQGSMWKTNFGRSLLKSKLEPGLKNTELNPSRLESYMLDSLWESLQNFENTNTRNPTFHNFQPYIPSVVQNPLVFQSPHAVPNPPRPMVAIIAPLDLPIVLHDLPQGYALKIPFYDEEGNFVAKQHVDRFDDLMDLELVDDDAVKMRLFMLILSGEANKWFKDLPAGSIHTFESFQATFLERWDDKRSPL